MSELQIFLRNDSGDGAYYCGPASDRAGVLKAIGYMLESDLDDLANWPDEPREFRLEAKMMTSEEVTQLPEI